MESPNIKNKHVYIYSQKVAVIQIYHFNKFMHFTKNIKHSDKVNESWKQR